MRWQKMALLVLPEGLACVVGAKPNVPFVRLAEKFNFFSCGGGVLIFLKLRNEGRLVSPISSKVVSFVCCCPPVKMFGRVSQFNFLVVC